MFSPPAHTQIGFNSPISFHNMDQQLIQLKALYDKASKTSKVNVNLSEPEDNDGLIVFKPENEDDFGRSSYKCICIMTKLDTHYWDDEKVSVYGAWQTAKNQVLVMLPALPSDLLLDTEADEEVKKVLGKTVLRELGFLRTQLDTGMQNRSRGIRLVLLQFDDDMCLSIKPYSEETSSGFPHELEPITPNYTSDVDDIEEEDAFVTVEKGFIAWKLSMKTTAASRSLHAPTQGLTRREKAAIKARQLQAMMEGAVDDLTGMSISTGDADDETTMPDEQQSGGAGLINAITGGGKKKAATTTTKKKKKGRK